MWNTTHDYVRATGEVISYRVFLFYKKNSRTSAVSSTNFGSILIFASCACYTSYKYRTVVKLFGATPTLWTHHTYKNTVGGEVR